MRTGRPPVAKEERFWAKVKVVESGCWEWTGALDKHGYGIFWLSERPGERKHMFAHCFAYELTNGAIPNGLEPDHLCRNHKCVNPEHLEAVTRSVNLRRGIGLSAQAIRRNQCLRGHEYTSDNTYVDKKGSRSCKTCRRQKSRNWWQKYGKEWRNASVIGCANISLC